MKAARPALLRHGVAYALLIAALLTVGGMILIYTLENQRAGSEITSWRAAAWWTFETVTTAGSETGWPESREGQVVRVVLVLAGLALFGLITARMASWFVEFDEEKHEAKRHAEVQGRLQVLEEKLDRLLTQAGRSPTAALKDPAVPATGGQADVDPPEGGGLRTPPPPPR